MSPTNGEMPDGKTVGRTAPAFSVIEDRLFHQTEHVARMILDALEEGADYEVITDAAGNMFFEIKGTDPEAEPLMSGSYLDAVADGGKYDGVAGVATALKILDTVAAKRG